MEFTLKLRLLNNLFRKGLFFSLILVSTHVSANEVNLTQVHVNASEVGQGFLLKRLDNCYLITPNHVLGDSFFSNIIAGTKTRPYGEAQTIQSFGYDVALSSVRGAVQSSCLTSIQRFGGLDSILNNVKRVNVASVNVDGSKSLIAAELTDLDLIHFYLSPINEKDEFYKGMSGSVVFDEETPLGMLQSIDMTTGKAKVLRFDRLIETIRPFFASGFGKNSSQSKRGESETQMMAQDVNTSSIPYSITEWNHHPIDNSLRVGHLNDGSVDTRWAVAPQKNKVELTLTFEKMQLINQATLIAHADDKMSMPKDFEIFANRRSKGKRGWVAIKSATWLNLDERMDLKLPPTKAKRLKIVFRSSWGDGSRLEFSELLFN